MTVKANSELRDCLHRERITQWQLGAVMGVSEMTVIRWLRTPLTPERRQKITQAVEQILREREG